MMPGVVMRPGPVAVPRPQWIPFAQGAPMQKGRTASGRNSPNPNQQAKQQTPPNQPLGAPSREGPAQAGVGLYFKMDHLGRYYVEMVLPNSSAEATGVVCSGDILEMVDDKSTEAVSLPQLRDMILGDLGSYVNLTFLREKGGEGFRYDLDLVRGEPNKFASSQQGQQLAIRSPMETQTSVASQKTVSPASGAKKTPMQIVPRAPAPVAQKSELEQASASFGLTTTTKTPRQHDVGAEDTSRLSLAEAERESYKKKYLAEQRMHLEAEQELQSQRDQISQLQKMVAQLQAKASQEGMSIDPARALHDGYVPKEDLVSALQRSHDLEKELTELRGAKVASQADTVPRMEYEALERRVFELQEEVKRQVSIVHSHQAGPRNDQIERMCVMALPAAVSALHSLSEETGHASSATWALVRAEDYVAHLASSRYPLSIPGLVTCIVKGAESNALPEAEAQILMSDMQDSCLAMSVISWDPEGRNMLLRDTRTVPALLHILGVGAGQAHAFSGDNAFAALNVPPHVICSRFAAMTLGNFSLDEGGRMSIVSDANAMEFLVKAISGNDMDTSSFSLLCAGNLFMIPEARQRFIRIPGAVEAIFDKLSSTEAMTIRFAVGAVRNFAADDACRNAVSSVRGSLAVLQDLSRNVNPRIRDHAEHALFNMKMTRPREAVSGGSIHATPVEIDSRRLSSGASRSDVENIGANLFGQA